MVTSRYERHIYQFFLSELENLEMIVIVSR
jgi:hypothetical protein